MCCLLAGPPGSRANKQQSQDKQNAHLEGPEDLLSRHLEVFLLQQLAAGGGHGQASARQPQNSVCTLLHSPVTTALSRFAKMSEEAHSWS
jgi:hypothetical protein